MARDALLAEIHAHPDDDAPRLVYADLLQQQGDPHGEFIAVQCAREHAPDDELLEARERELWAKHGASWCEALEVSREHVIFRRGFVHEIVQLESPSQGLRDHPVEILRLTTPPISSWPTTSLDRWLSWADALRPRQLEVLVWPLSAVDYVLRPLLLSGSVSRVRRLALDLPEAELARIDPWLASLEEHRDLPALDSLHLDIMCSEAQLRRFLQSRPCRELKRLFLKGTVHGSSEAALTACALPLKSLHFFALSEQSPLSSWPSLAGLEQLSLSQFGFSLPNLPALLSRCPGLVSLDVSGFPRFHERLPDLRLLPLRKLALCGLRLAPEHIVSLFDGVWCGELRELDLSWTPLPYGPGLQHLGRVLRRLEVLKLEGASLDDRGLSELVRHGALQHLRELKLSRLSAWRVALLAEHAPALRALHVGNTLEPDVLEALASHLAGRLRELRVGLGPDEEQLERLAEAPFHKLRELTVSGNARGHAYIRGASWFAGLQSCQLLASLEE